MSKLHYEDFAEGASHTFGPRTMTRDEIVEIRKCQNNDSGLRLLVLDADIDAGDGSDLGNIEPAVGDHLVAQPVLKLHAFFRCDVPVVKRFQFHQFAKRKCRTSPSATT